MGPIGRRVQPSMIVRRRTRVRKPDGDGGIPAKGPVFDIGESGEIVEAPSLRDAIDQERKDRLPIPEDAAGNVHQAKDFLGHDAQRRTSQEDRGAGPGADDIDDPPQVVQEEHRVPHVVVVDVAHRDADQIGLESRHGRFHLGRRVPDEHQIQEMNGMAGMFRGVGEDAGADGHHGHGQGVPVRADEKDFHARAVCPNRTTLAGEVSTT